MRALSPTQVSGNVHAANINLRIDDRLAQHLGTVDPASMGWAQLLRPSLVFTEAVVTLSKYVCFCFCENQVVAKVFLFDLFSQKYYH